MQVDTIERTKATELLRDQIDHLIQENPEVGDFREGFQAYCMGKYSLGTSASTISTSGKGDLGVAFFSSRDRTYHVVQCRVPERDWLESHPDTAREFGPAVVQETRVALQYLLEETDLLANDRLVQLGALIRNDRPPGRF